MIEKKYGKDFSSYGGALTLRVQQVSDLDYFIGYSEKTHESGWTICGEVVEDYFHWVNEFSATHKKYGKVYGDFEKSVFADSEEGFQHFWENHQPEEWDYMDI